MKSRSHRLPDPPDDWIDGSWTVDCSCGVTFDDGEEMVSCDECGVWVHTRCSRFVKGEASFACHNCKKNDYCSNSSKKPSSTKPSPAAADTEETEVAQLLIELPTKADPCPPPNLFPVPAYRAPFRLWAEVPMEERVHVQGVPGGDPSLFQGISSSVFTSELWRCAGYVPKKFNFQYRELPRWDEDTVENPASHGANVLFSLSKEIVPSCVPVRAFETKQEGEKVLFGSRLQSWGKKERNKLRVFGSQHSNKRRKEDVGDGKDRSGKKKARSDADRAAAEFKKRGSEPVGEAKKAGLAEDAALHVAESDVPAVKSEERKEDVLPEHNLGDQVGGGDSGKKKAVRSEADRVAAEFKRRAISLPVSDTKKFELSEDEGVQVAESNVLSQKLEGPSVKSEERKEDVPSQKSEGPPMKSEDRKEEVPPQNNASDQVEIVDNEIKKENGLVVRVSKDGIADEAASLKIASSSELTVKIGTADGTTGLSSKAITGASPKADVSTVHRKQDNNIKGSAKGEDLSKVAHALKQSKDESHLQGDSNSSTRAKLVSSGSCQKNEKMNQPVPQPPSRFLSHAISMHPPTSASAPTTLSDEELALLLHQELNSSPRVPRVPRMRQASSSQLTSQIAPSMLSKRASHSGGKDQALRRKNKEETSRDGSRNSQDSIDETKRTGRALSSPDRKYRELSCTTDSSSKKRSRNRSPDITVSMKKNSGPSTEGENSSQPCFETSGQSTLSIKSSTRDVLDDDITPRTLPGLIDEILSKCKCSTYEELCDAVRPHWHNVRKPNGDRYAYSSHSHAVLDCLRNRSEWSHLIDRGPKTNSSKRRRKLDSDLPTMEESENEEAKTRASREVEDKNRDSHREDVPKGKRKARKRRRLELRGRRVDKGKKIKRASSSGSAIGSDDDDNNDDESAAAFSHSSNEGADGIFSEEESQGAVDRSVGPEASVSTSSDG